jgi:hypothetical protein
VTWPGAGKSDKADKGWLVERMARVLGLRANSPGGIVLAKGDKSTSQIENEDDIEYEDAPELYKGPDHLSALPLALKARSVLFFSPCLFWSPRLPAFSDVS